MKWYKHYVDSLDDPFIVELMDKYKHQGYTFYFGLIGIVCQQIGHDLDKKFECSPIYLKRKLRISTTKVIEMLDFCSTKGKLIYSFEKENLNILIPNITKIKDNYTKDLQGGGKKVSLEEEKEEEKEEDKEEDKEKEMAFDYKEHFEQFWKQYIPNRKIGKDKALTKFKKDIKNEDDFNQLLLSLNNYKSIIKKNKTEEQFIKQGSSFMSVWKDYLEVEVEVKEEEDYSEWGK